MPKYVPIDPDDLTPDQRELWDKFMVPADPSITREFADAQFRQIAAFEGVPLEAPREPTGLGRWAKAGKA
jgi:hypothetical protein